MSDPAACARMLADVGDRIDILVNNAGSYHEAGSILDQSVESWQRSIELNLASLFNCSKPVAARMVEQGDGRSDRQHRIGRRAAAVSRHRVRLGQGRSDPLRESLAVDLALHGIRVNAVSPGVVPVPTLDQMHAGEIDTLWPNEPSKSGLMGPLMSQRSSNVPLGSKGTPTTSAGQCCSW